MPDEETPQAGPAELAGQSEPQEEKLDCSITVEDTGPWKKKIIVVIPRSQIDQEQDRQFGQLRWTVEVPGFRKGRAPRRLIEKRYGEELANQGKVRLLTRALERAEEEYKFEVLGEPELDVESLEVPAEGDFRFEYEIEVKPQFELPPLEGIRIEKPLFEITEERVDEALEGLRVRLGRVEPVTDGPVRADDWVTVDVSAQAEGAEQPILEQDVALRVGRTAVMGVLIEDMEKVLAKVQPGETRTCSGAASAEHPQESWRGKNVQFSLTVKAIRRLAPAELNEELFSRLGASDAGELRGRIRADLEGHADREIRNLMAQQVRQYFDEAVKFDLPVGLAARHTDRLLARRYYELLQQGVRQEMIHENLEQLRAASGEESRRRLKMSFILERVAEQLEVKVADAEVNGVVAQVAARYGRRPERLRDELVSEGRYEQIRQQMRDDKAVDRILEMAVVVDAPARQPEAPAGSPKKASKKAPAAPTESAAAGEAPAETKKSSGKKAAKGARPASTRQAPGKES